MKLNAARRSWHWIHQLGPISEPIDPTADTSKDWRSLVCRRCSPAGRIPPCWRPKTWTRQLLPCSLFIVYAALCGLINREPGGCSKFESAAPVDIVRWHPVGDCDGLLRILDHHGN